MLSLLTCAAVGKALAAWRAAGPNLPASLALRGVATVCRETTCTAAEIKRKEKTMGIRALSCLFGHT